MKYNYDETKRKRLNKISTMVFIILTISVIILLILMLKKASSTYLWIAIGITFFTFFFYQWKIKKERKLFYKEVIGVIVSKYFSSFKYKASSFWLGIFLIKTCSFYILLHRLFLHLRFDMREKFLLTYNNIMFDVKCFDYYKERFRIIAFGSSIEIGGFNLFSFLSHKYVDGVIEIWPTNLFEKSNFAPKRRYKYTYTSNRDYVIVNDKNNIFDEKNIQIIRNFYNRYPNLIIMYIKDKVYFLFHNDIIAKTFFVVHMTEKNINYEVLERNVEIRANNIRLMLDDFIEINNQIEL